MSSKEEAIFDIVDYDLPFCCIAPCGVAYPDLTEAQLQMLEERADRFYASLM